MIPIILKTIPEKALAQLDCFFQFLLREKAFAYTLFGNKPMSVFYYPCEITSSELYWPSEYLTIEKGWEVWQKFSSQFPSHHFVLKRCRLNDHWEITLINKQLTAQAIETHLHTFQRTLGYSMEPDQFLEQLCSSVEPIRQTLKGHPNLSRLLGAGKADALDVTRKIRLISPTHSPVLPNDSLAVSNGYVHVPLCKLNDWFLSKITAPIFANRPETKKLQNEYKETMQTLRRAYRKRPFLEVTLRQWMDPK